MNSNFDDLSKAMAEGVSRREAIWRFGVFLAGTVLACIGLGSAAQSDPNACKTYCSRFPKGPERSHCMQVCNACPSTTLLYGTTGFNLVCCTGPGLAFCNGVCVNRATDPHNCGACGYDCGSLPNVISTCINGTCSYACADGFANCDGVASNGCEVNLAFDPNNCGACGYVCPESAPDCVNGICSPSSPCGPGQALCDGQCVWISYNNENCGGCGIQCEEGTQCLAGICQPIDP
jgi:hypothetical protein